MLTPLGRVEDHVTIGRSWAAAHPSCHSMNASPSYRGIRLDHLLNTSKCREWQALHPTSPSVSLPRQSWPEQGSCHEPHKPPRRAVARGLLPRASYQRLLVVDDAAVRSVVAEALLEDGYQVDAACNGRQALAAFREHRPDALVLDLEMPIMNGPALMRTLRERTKWGRVPLVASAGCPRLGKSSAQAPSS
jgi:hypothetical protein